MLTGMREEDWTTVLAVFKATRSRRGDKGRNDRRFLEALHYFVIHNITWRALPVEYGHWNSVWKRFWRLSQTGFFEAFFEALAGNSWGAARLAETTDCGNFDRNRSVENDQGREGQRRSPAFLCAA